MQEEEECIQPSWVRVGRVVAERGQAGRGPKKKGPDQPRHEFLVKWEGLPYEHASWEEPAAVAGPEFERELDRFRSRRPIADTAAKHTVNLPSPPVLGGCRYTVVREAHIGPCVCRRAMRWPPLSALQRHPAF